MTNTEGQDPRATPASWQADENEVIESSGRGKRLLLVVIGLVVVLVIVGGVAFVVNDDGPEERAWPAALDGRPAGLGENEQTVDDVVPEADPGAYIWSGFDGWHLWVVNGEGVEGLEGTITSTHDFATASLSAADSGSVTNDGKTITFDLDGSVPLAGIDFGPDFFAKQMVFTLNGPDGPIDVSLITLGTETPADANPVVIDKAVVEE